MSLLICIADSAGERVCFPGPVPIRKFRRPVPDPDPRLEALLDVFGPQPEPRIIADHLDQQVIQDLEVVAALDTVVMHASPKVSEVLQSALQQSIASLPLPDGMTLHQAQRG